MSLSSMDGGLAVTARFLGLLPEFVPHVLLGDRDMYRICGW